MLIRDRWREPTSKVGYSSTGKELPSDDFEGRQYAYWILAGRIEDEFGGEPAMVYEIYRRVTSPLGLSSSDTTTLIKGAKKEGYLK